MNLKSIFSLRRVQDMARVNKGETEIFPYDSYELRIYGNDHNPPHFHIKSLQEKYHITVEIDTGELYQVKSTGRRGRKDKFIDVVKMAKLWLAAKPTTKKDYIRFSTNREKLEYVWNLQQD